MIKRIFINQRAIPVPVPVLTFSEAMDWVGNTLVPEGHCITRVQLDGELMDLENPKVPNRSLTASSQLNLIVDGPEDLAIQTIDAIKNLVSSIQSVLKPISVGLWTHAGDQYGEDMNNVIFDLRLVSDLFAHASDLMDGVISYQNASHILGNLNEAVDLCVIHSERKDWRCLAKVLLRNIEPLMLDLSSEAQSFQSAIFEYKASYF